MPAAPFSKRSDGMGSAQGRYIRASACHQGAGRLAVFRRNRGMVISHDFYNRRYEGYHITLPYFIKLFGFLPFALVKSHIFNYFC